MAWHLTKTSRIAQWVVVGVSVAAGAYASESTRRTASTPVNANVLRSASGTIAYRVMSTGRINGYEWWRLSVHPDGSRTMSATVQYSPRDVLRHIVHRVDHRYRPRESYAAYWLGGSWRGSVLLNADGAELGTVIRSPAGEQRRAFHADGALAIVPHALAVDSWRALFYDVGTGGVQAIPSVVIDTPQDGPTLDVRMTSYRFVRVGKAKVSAPAGSFETEHFRIEDTVDIYVLMPDAIVVKFVFAAIDREHLLIEYQASR